MSSCLEQTAWTAACNKVVLVKLSASFFLAQQGKKQLMHQRILSEKLDDLKVVTHLEVVTHVGMSKGHLIETTLFRTDLLLSGLYNNVLFNGASASFVHLRAQRAI